MCAGKIFHLILESFMKSEMISILILKLLIWPKIGEIASKYFM